ncbi:MAG: SDR family NAD(P)-dependent oxidoreductase [Saprospiraceae bacterium]
MLKDKIAIITGASRGIGKAGAYLFGKAGAKLVVVGRNQENLDRTVNEFKLEGIDVIAVAAHVGKEDDLKRVVKITLDRYGKIDILVNNAATSPVFNQIENIDNNLFDKIMEINVKSAFILSKLVFEQMKEQGGGSIINISSVEGKKPSAGLSLYSMSKAALIHLTRSMALEWGKHNIRVNAICPGLIQTQFSEVLWKNEKILEHFIKQVPLKRIAQPEEMAGLILFLASEQSSYITGSIIDADGGYLI